MLLASFYFYMCWRVDYIILILISSIIDYVAGLKIKGADKKSRRIAWLVLSLTGNLGLLFAFKYFNLFNNTFSFIASNLGFRNPVSNLDVLLPVGISFYTFQTMSYSLDIYRGKMEPTKHLGKFMLFVMFFPQLVAGPIERASHLLKQFDLNLDFNYKRLAHGAIIILWGLFKKVVIADNAARYVDMIYKSPDDFSGLALILATYFFAIQIYCDFSGYSDIAIGCAEIFGIEIMQNFKRPYFAKNFEDVWNRWHISLSTWLRDYLYISLGGNRKGHLRTYINIFITMILGGLWHGANWTYLIWGLCCGLFIVISKFWSSYSDKIHSFLRTPYIIKTIWQRFLTFHLLCFTWIIFRSDSFKNLFLAVKKIFFFQKGQKTGFSLDLVYRSKEIYLLILSIIILFIVQLIQERKKQFGLEFIYEWFPKPVRWGFYFFLVFFIILWGVDGSKAFIYFQF